MPAFHGDRRGGGAIQRMTNPEMAPEQKRTFAACMPALAEVLAFVEEAGMSAGMSRPDTLRVVFVVEELFTNTVTHGHGGDSGASVEIALLVKEGQARLTYVDHAPAFDPLEGFKVEPGSLTATLSQRPVGGLGSWLVGHLVETAHYRRDAGRNILELSVPLAA